MGPMQVETDGGAKIRPPRVLAGSHKASLERSRLDFLDRITRRGVSAATIEAMSRVRREMFVPPQFRLEAYRDAALPTAKSQTISQPSLVARMIDLLEIEPHHHVLEVGAGSGYQAAVLSLLASHVVSVERIPELTEAAKSRLRQLGYDKCRIEQAGDELGWPSAAPYDRIIVAAAAPNVPAALSRQLGPGGRMVIPVGRRTDQDLLVVSRTSRGLTVKRDGKCMFVPLIGRDAWKPT